MGEAPGPGADIAPSVGAGAGADASLPVFIAPPLRLPVRRLLRSSLPQLPVIGFSEASGLHQIETVGQVSSGEFVA